MPRISFFGAAQTVTGSRHLLEIENRRILVDCGLFQGGRELRDRNLEPFPVEPHTLDAVVLTHAHMDHIGYLPKLVADGYSGPIYSTRATLELCRISLPDSARLQEEDARTRSKHEGRKVEPLYTEEMAYACLKQFETVSYRTMTSLPGGATFRYLFAGHILGSGFAEIYFPSGERILMSGDLGRYDRPIIKDPEVVDFAEYLVLESTYGDRNHAQEDPKAVLSDVLHEAMQRGSTVIVPSFAIGRTQELLYFISELQEEGRAPRIPVFVDSPMATSVTGVYTRVLEEHDDEMRDAMADKVNMMEPAGLTLVRDREQSRALNANRGPAVIISGSGMANGGRVIHHLLHRLDDPDTIVLFTGYQAEGTLGRRILEKQPEVRIFGREVPVRAEVRKLNSLSAHADQGEILRWLSNFKQPPRKTFLVHGEPNPQRVLKEKIVERFGWDVEIPQMYQSFEL